MQSVLRTTYTSTASLSYALRHSAITRRMLHVRHGLQFMTSMGSKKKKALDSTAANAALIDLTSFQTHEPVYYFLHSLGVFSWGLPIAEELKYAFCWFRRDDYNEAIVLVVR